MRSCRGYQRLGANVTRYGEEFQRDWHEAIDLYREVPQDQSAVRPARLHEYRHD